MLVGFLAAACAGKAKSNGGPSAPLGPTGASIPSNPTPGNFSLTGPAESLSATTSTLPVTVSWSAAAQASSYGWRVGRTSSCGDVAAEGITTEQSVLTSGLTVGTYYACVVAANEAGTTAASNNGWRFTIAAAPPASFSLDTRAHQRRDRASIAWSGSDGAVSYRASLARDSDCADEVFVAEGVTATQVVVPRTAERFGPLFACVSATAENGQTRAAINSPQAVYFGAFVLGQPDAFTVPENSGLGGDNVPGNLRGPVGACRVADRLFVANHDEHAIEVYDATGGHPRRRPLFSLGQPGLMDVQRAGSPANPPTASSLRFPKAVASDGIRLAVADTGNNRVLIWNSLPTTFATPADVVLGQTDMAGNTVAAVSASSLNKPESVAFVGSGAGAKLIVADRDNHRVLIWNTVPTSHNTAASLVLGQADFTSATPACSASAMRAPADIVSDGTKLVVADAENFRALVWSSLPTQNGQSADAVLGQADAVTCTAPGTVNAQSLSEPRGVAIDSNGKIYVSDRTNNRIVRYASPVSTAAAPELVIGQATFGSNTAGASRTELRGPTRLSVVGSTLLVSDTTNGRLVTFSTNVIDGGEALSLLGKFAFDGEPSDEIVYPGAVASNDAALFIADYTRSGAKIFGSIPNRNAAAANYDWFPVAGVSDTQIRGPWDSVYCAGRVVMSDYTNHRFVVVDPTTTPPTISRAFGQPDLMSDLNPTPPTASSISDPYAVACSGTRLIVADSRNNRVLIWLNPWTKQPLDPDFNGTPADIVLGQASMTTSTNGTAMDELDYPVAVSVDESTDRLYVSDLSNRRVLVWNDFSMLNSSNSGIAANVVIGYAPADGVPSGNPAPSATTFGEPYGLVARNGRLWLASSQGSRVLEFANIPMSQDAGSPAVAAVAVFGQDNFTASAKRAGGAASDEVLCGPESLGSDSRYLYISDSCDQRVLMLPNY